MMTPRQATRIRKRMSIPDPICTCGHPKSEHNVQFFSRRTIPTGTRLGWCEHDDCACLYYVEVTTKVKA